MAHLVKGVGIRRAMASLTARRAFSSSREELHAMALKQHDKFKIEQEQNMRNAEDLAMTQIPQDLKFHFRDTPAERAYKERQQQYLYMEQNYGYVEDILAQQGLVDQAALDQKRETMKKRLASKHYLTDQVQAPAVDLTQLKLVQVEYGAPEDLRVKDEDSASEIQRKVKGLVQFFVQKSTEALKQQPSTAEEVREKAKDAEKIYRSTEEDVAAFLKANEGRISDLDVPVVGTEEFKKFVLEVHEAATQNMNTLEVEHMTRVGALQKLGLVQRGALDKIETELKESRRLANKRMAEFKLRFGVMPDMENDPYLLEANDQIAFMTAKLKEKVAAKKDEETQAKLNADSEEGEEESGIVEEDDVEDEATRKANINAYNLQRTPRTFLSTEEQDGSEWPKMVDGLELSKYEDVRDVDYDSFESPPSAFEVRVLDAFAKQRQFRAAKERQQREYERSYRDISHLNLEVPYDPENPWKQDMFNEAELVLKNNGSWTTAQKEQFMTKMHRLLVSDAFDKKNKDYVQF